MELLIAYILLALVVSFLCSVLEATLLTVSPVSVERAKESGAKWGLRMERSSFGAWTALPGTKEHQSQLA